MAADLTLIKTSVGFLRGLFVSSEAGGGWSVLNDMVVPSKPVRITALIFIFKQSIPIGGDVICMRIMTLCVSTKD